MSDITTLLNELNAKMAKSHQAYEEFFWKSYMGDHGVDEKMIAAEAVRDEFRSDRNLSDRVKTALTKASGEEKTALEQWQQFFACYQVPESLVPLRKEVAELEAKIQKERGSRTEGYVDPKTGDFVEASRNKMRMIMMVEADEELRKACFEAVDKLSVSHVNDLIKLVQMRNEFARGLGYEDFYDYRLQVAEGMQKEELFALFDDLYEQTRYGFDNIRELEREKPGIRLPWNQSYMLAGDVKKQQDPYLDFGKMLLWWGRSFAALGIGFQGATLQLDLVERKGKYDNGFCHWPKLVKFDEKTGREPGASNFTCNAIPGQVGSGERAGVTLFHEGGHAAHLTNVETRQVCMNHEYDPLSTAWAETQSMFLDAMQSSPEWLTRYAHDAKGNPYPFSLIEEELRKVYPKQPLRFMSIMAVVEFERQLYELDRELTQERVLEIAREVGEKYFDYSVDTHYVLQVPHIYSWDSSCYYHGYGLAQLAVAQWRDYFYNDKHGFIVDNPEVGNEMYEVWKLGASKSFGDFVKLATGKPLSVDTYVNSISGTVEYQLERIKERIAKLENIPRDKGPVELDAHIKMVHGKELIADNEVSFEDMAERYAAWLKGLEEKAAA